MRELFTKSIKLDDNHSITIIETPSSGIMIQGYNDFDAGTRVQQLIFRPVAIKAIVDTLIEYLQCIDAKQKNNGTHNE